MDNIGFAAAAPDLAVVCVNRVKPFEGELYHRYSAEPVPFHSEYEIIDQIDKLCDAIGYPSREMRLRTFRRGRYRSRRNSKEAEKVMSFSELTNKTGEEGTFMIHVQYRQNATWQGQVTWVERKQTQQFRSALELLKLIDSALDQSGDKEQK